MKKKISLFFVFALAMSVLLSLSLYTVSMAKDSVAVVSFDQFTSGNGNSSGQNNMSHGGDKQSKFERVKGADGGYYAVFSPTLTGTNPGHAFVQNKFGSGVKLDSASGNKYLVYDVDIATETQYFPKLDFEFIGRKTDDSANQFSNVKPKVESDGNGGWKLTMSGKSVPMESERGKWQHITLIIEAVRTSSGTLSSASKIYLYYNGKFVASASNAFKGDLLSLNSMRISMNTGAAVTVEDTLCVDNVRVSSVKESSSEGLASVLADSSRSLTEWSESYYVSDYQFPKTRAIASADGKYFSNVSQIEDEMKKNPGVEFTVLGNVQDTVDILGECFFYNPNGYTLNYNKGELNMYETSSSLAFLAESGKVEITWHVGESTMKFDYNVGVTITAPDYDSVYEKNGVSYKATGVSKNEGGASVIDFGIASKYNNEFFVIFSESIAYCVGADGKKEFAYSESELDGLFASSVNGDVITLTSDVTFGASGASAYTFTGKSVTFDLGGHTATIAKLKKGHIFTLGKNGTFTVKNGVLNGRDNGRIPEGEQSIIRRNIFKINNDATGAALFVEDMYIEATKLMTVVGNGSATFRNCKIDFKHDYENMIDLYSNGNASNPTKLIIENSSFEGYKTLINTYKPSGVTGCYTELEIKNSTLVTDERIVASASLSKAVLDGGYFKGQYIFAGTSANTSASVQIKGGTHFSVGDLDETNALTFTNAGQISKTGDKSYPFMVTDSYAKITWDMITKTYSEYWVKGVVPVPPIDVPTNTSAIRYTMDKIVAVSGDKTYRLTVGLNFTPKISYSFGQDFGLNVYLPEVSYKSLDIGGAVLAKNDISTVSIDGKAYYKLSSPVNAPTEKLVMRMVYDTSVGERIYTVDVSLLTYIDAILSGECVFEAYNVALSALAYLNASAGENASAILTNMIEVYDISKVAYPMATGLSRNLSEIVSDWTLDGEILKIYFKSDFSGVVEIEYGSEKTTAEISSGKVGENEFVAVRLPIYLLAEGAKISFGEYSGRLGLASYAEKLGNTKDYMALYSYAKCAEVYYNSKGGEF